MSTANNKIQVKSNKSKKHHEAARTIIFQSVKFTFKNWRKMSNDFVYRCGHSSRVCEARLIVPITQNFDGNMELINEKSLEDVSFEGKHTCQNDAQRLSKTLSIEIKTQKHDINVLRESIINDLLKSVNYFYLLMLRQNQKFTKSEIEKHLQEIRGDLFPTDNHITFTEDFCKCLDFTSSGWNLFQDISVFHLVKKPLKKLSEKLKILPKGIGA